MATKPPAERPSENGKPKRGPAPVVRMLEVADEDSRDRLLHKHAPALLISGGLHIVAALLCVVLSSFISVAVAKGPPPKPATTDVQEPEQKPEDLTNEDKGFDPEIAASVDVPREANVTVEAAVDQNAEVGIPNQTAEFANQTSVEGISTELGTVGVEGTGTTGLAATGTGGGGSQTIGGMQGRSGATKERLLRAGGGNGDTEAAVAAGLAWLARQQDKGNGSWTYDKGHEKDHVAATGMSLLPFLAAGETHVSGKKYQQTVRAGLAYLKGQQQPSGLYGKGSTMYSHAIATIAVCEAAGMTKDSQLLAQAAGAINYIIKAQASNGSWGYQANTDGDTSIVGWQVQALKSGKLAGIPVKEKVMKDAESFLESVSDNSGATYGYRTKGNKLTLNGVGLLCRQYMGWKPLNPGLARGVEMMWAKQPPKANHWDMYYYYYATQVFHFFDGPAWHRDWNPLMRQLLVDKQKTAKTAGVKAADIGSWPADDGSIGTGCGVLGTTCLAILTLEVYYRHLPLYKRDNAGGLAELEKGN